MSKDTALSEFVEYCQRHIKGDEKGEAQIFLDHFFTALGYPAGLKGAGAECEYRVKQGNKKSTSFADLVWKPRVLIEMKKRDEDLSIHLQQASAYWMNLVPDRPEYVILCNFDEFWIYNFNVAVYQPQDVVLLEELPTRAEAFGFLLPKKREPIFQKDRVDVTGEVAKEVSYAFKSMLKRKVPHDVALCYCLQCIVAMFSEDVELLPHQIFTRLIQECEKEPGSGFDKVSKSYDLIGGLFREMNTMGISEGELYRGVDYFNGGLFKKTTALELTKFEVERFATLAAKKWQNVNPAIFGNIFEQNLETDERHKLGAHYTHEIDIKKIVNPVIVEPWTERIEEADTIDEFKQLLIELSEYKVLDPACGSGNFLFVAFKEMKLLEGRLMARWKAAIAKDGKRLKEFQHFWSNHKFVTTDQFYGMDIKPDAVELAKVTLMVAKELAWIENNKRFESNISPLPLDTLDKNIICCDALLNGAAQREWPDVDAIIGNPPYQSKNKMQQEFGLEYLNKLRAAYPEVPGRADFCVYWYYSAHNRLKPEGYAGLVGTNTIRQNYSREGSLDYIVKNGGEIFNAVSSQVWSGEAAVFVSIVNWKKGKYKGVHRLYNADGKGEQILHERDSINSSLSLQVDVTSAKVLECNKEPKRAFQGQTHGHEGFLMSRVDGERMLKKHPEYEEVLKPFLIGDELLGNVNAEFERYVIDFSKHDIVAASKFKELFSIVERKVLPDRKRAGEKEEARNKALRKDDEKAKINKHKSNFLKTWWKISWSKEELVDLLNESKKYIAISRVSKRPIFEFISTEIRPSDALMAFCFEDYYSFGVIQSSLHFNWFVEKCSTLEGRYRYTTDSVWDTFPWPQTPTKKQIEKVTKAAQTLHEQRTKTLKDYNMSLRDLYRLIEQPGKNAIRDLHEKLDAAVMEAYGFSKDKDVLEQLLELNLEVAGKEKRGEKVRGAGLPM